MRALLQIPSSDRPWAGFVGAGRRQGTTSIKWVPALYPLSIVSLNSQQLCKGGITQCCRCRG